MSNCASERGRGIIWRGVLQPTILPHLHRWGNMYCTVVPWSHHVLLPIPNVQVSVMFPFEPLVVPWSQSLDCLFASQGTGVKVPCPQFQMADLSFPAPHLQTWTSHVRGLTQEQAYWKTPITFLFVWPTAEDITAGWALREAQSRYRVNTPSLPAMWSMKTHNLA